MRQRRDDAVRKWRKLSLLWCLFPCSLGRRIWSLRTLQSAFCSRCVELASRSVVSCFPLHLLRLTYQFGDWDLRRVSAVRSWEQREWFLTGWRCAPSVAGGEEGSRRCAWLEGQRRERERTSGKMLLLFKLKGAWWVASGCLFITGKAWRNFRVKSQASYWLKSNTMDHSRCTCRYTMVVLWGIVVPHIAHAQTQMVYGIRLNINISGLS